MSRCTLLGRIRSAVGFSEDGTAGATDGTVDTDADASATDGNETVQHLGRWLALLSPLLVPWVVVRTTSATLVFPWGMVTLESWHVVSLPGYLEATHGLPQHLRMWPLGALCYGLALVWAAGERIGSDQRVTAGLFVLASITVAWLSSGLGVEPNRTAIPLGSILLFALAVWAYVRA